MISNHLESASAAAPCVMVIFGATGALTKRKLIPALLNLARRIYFFRKSSPLWALPGNDLDTDSFPQNSGPRKIAQFCPRIQSI